MPKHCRMKVFFIFIVGAILLVGFESCTLRNGDRPFSLGPGVQTRVPPVPSGWTSGAVFTPPAPIPIPSIPESGPFNMLNNPGFEDGTAPWWYFPDRAHWGSFTTSTAKALSGSWAARVELLMNAMNPPRSGASIQGLIQSIQTSVFPFRVFGNYYVEKWDRSPTKMYMQVVVIASGTKNTSPGGAPAEISYLLTGIDHPPFNMINRKFIFLTKTQPEVGRWIHFERDLRKDFKEQWGFVPENISGIRIFFELRADMRGDNIDLSTPPSMHAIAYFDDLYLGN
ncbi:MAG: hypothetical protein WCQ99_04155 [Pseudomonadota bacterium]